jgi:hypothetical protein
MFQINTHSSAITVAVDGATGRPREIRASGERLAVSDLESVRDETAAYPLESGPRTVFVVRAEGRRYRLVHLIRDRRWTMEELESQAAGLSQAA